MSPPSHGHRLVRDAALQLALRCESARRLLDPRQSRPYSYAASALTTLCAEIDYLRGPLPGEALGDLRLQEGDFLSDRLGRGFNLLVVAREGLERPQPAAVEQTAARRRIPFKTVFIDTDTIPATSEVFHRLGAEPLALYLLRPDRYVCARWRQWDGERIVSALARAAGRPQHDR